MAGTMIRAAILAFAVPAVVSAQPVPAPPVTPSGITSPVASPSPTTTLQETCPLEDARRFFVEGVRLFGDRRFAESVTSFEQSLCHPFPVAHYNLALAYQALGRTRDAITEFEACLSGYQHTNPPDPDATDERLNAIRAVLAEQRARVVQILVGSVDPPNTILRIDDRPQSSNGPFTAENPLQLDPGHHVITWSAPDHMSVRWEEDFGPGDRLHRSVSLRWQQDGRLVIEPSVDTAVVSLDGQRVGVGHYESSALPPGTHDVDIRADHYLPFHRTVQIFHTGVVRVDASLEHNPRPAWVLPVAVAGGVVLTAAVIGAIAAATTSGPRPLFDPNWTRVIEHFQVGP